MKIRIIGAVLMAVIGIGVYGVADASHDWAGYHWARTANPFTLQLGDNVTSAWDSYLVTTSSDWSVSSVLDTVIKPGNTKPRLCKPTAGRVEVCNEKYGSNGWLGIAQVWVNGDHITQGVVKMNDTYFTTKTYNTPAWRNLVMCQEVGHTLGLDHQDENFSNANLGTCMDYTNNPATNQHPNAHDYEMLELLYGHFDGSTSVLSSSATTKAVGKELDLTNPSAWGKAVKTDAQGNSSMYKRDLGDGQMLVTHVTWVEGFEEKHDHE